MPECAGISPTIAPPKWRAEGKECKHLVVVCRMLVRQQRETRLEKLEHISFFSGQEFWNFVSFLSVSVAIFFTEDIYAEALFA